MIPNMNQISIGEITTFREVGDLLRMAAEAFKSDNKRMDAIEEKARTNADHACVLSSRIDRLHARLASPGYDADHLKATAARVDCLEKELLPAIEARISNERNERDRTSNYLLSRIADLENKYADALRVTVADHVAMAQIAKSVSGLWEMLDTYGIKPSEDVHPTAPQADGPKGTRPQFGMSAGMTSDPCPYIVSATGYGRRACFESFADAVEWLNFVNRPS